MKLSTTTVMLPQYDMRETAEFLAGLGVDGIEWRCRYIPEGQQDQEYTPWGNVKNDLSPDNLDVRGEELVALSEEFSQPIACLATAMSATETDVVRKVAEGCAKWGIGMFRIGAPNQPGRGMNYREVIDSAIRAFEAALVITREYGVRAVLEIHRGAVACSASQAYLVVKEFDPADIGVIFDIANMSLGEGYEPFHTGLDLLGPYVAHVHCGGGKPVEVGRDGLGQATYNWETCDLADSHVDVAQFLRELDQRDYQGFISIEDFRSIPPNALITTQLEFLRSVMP